MSEGERILSDRERGFEAQFVHDEELRFRLQARRDKLFAQHIAAQAGLDASAAAALREQVLHLHGGPGHDAQLLALAAAAWPQDQRGEPLQAQLAAWLEGCASTARQEIMAAG